MKKHSCKNTVFGPGFGRPHDDKRGNGRTAAHPQRNDEEDEEDEFASGHREARDIEGNEDIRNRARNMRESFEHDSKEGAESRTSRSISAERI